ncbi:MAG: hypothetical protein AB7K09_14040 [Planctomycetota bacterium]
MILDDPERAAARQILAVSDDNLVLDVEFAKTPRDLALATAIILELVGDADSIVTQQLAVMDTATFRRFAASGKNWSSAKVDRPFSLVGESGL